MEHTIYNSLPTPQDADEDLDIPAEEGDNIDPFGNNDPLDHIKIQVIPSSNPDLQAPSLDDPLLPPI